MSGGGGKGARDLQRVVSGIALVLAESLRRSSRSRVWNSPSSHNSVIGVSSSSSSSTADLIGETLKRAVLSATDLAGITSGRIIRYNHDQNQNQKHPSPSSSSYDHNNNSTGSSSFHSQTSRSSSSSSSSVVYFSDENDDSSEPPNVTATPIITITTNEVTNSIPQVVDDKTTTVLVADDAPQSSHDSIVTVNHEAEVDTSSSSSANAEEQHVTQSSSSSSSSGGTGTIPTAEAAARQQHPPVLSSSSNSNSNSIRKRRRPRERRVPSTPLSRAFGFAGLGAGLAWGTLQESAKRVLYGTPQQSAGNTSAVSPFLSDQNAERLALALCRMRGAALKLGQMLSIQDESLVPAPVLAALDMVRQGADVMPRSQLNDVLYSELGLDWTKQLKSFDYEPLAAASIGQVHRAVMKDGLEVAMKIQYPGVADSIDSDIENVRRLLDYTNLIPKGLFLDRAMKVAKEELSWECDYELESRNQKRFRDLLSESEGVYVPMVIDEMSSKKVLTTELVSGIPIDKVAALSQEVRSYVGRKLLELTLKELFVFRFMQTDPNWSNFLYDESTNMINLIDFGAARDYRKGFVDDYLRMVIACADRDKESIVEMSTRLGFLTGMESQVMLDAHVQASFIVGLPFSTSGAYDFRASNITSSIAHLGATMLKHRLTPPPDEAYSLHRKLSGAFLACIKLEAAVPCRDLLLQVHQQYRFSDENEESLANMS